MSTTFSLSSRATSVYEDFLGLLVRHPLQEQAFEQVLASLTQARGDGCLTVLFGPTGVGKTTLWELVTTAALKADQERAQAGTIPYLYVLADVPSSGTFQLKAFYYKTLSAADEILIDRKIVPGAVRSPHPFSRSTSDALRTATMSMLRHRRPFVFCVDEAQHLGIHSSERQMANNLDAIKVFAKESEAPVLLIGTYQLVEFPALSGQLARLVRRVHFPRYDVGSVEGRRGFRDVLYFFEKHLPLAESYRLLDEREMFHTRTIGCVGVLKQWLGRALFRALADGRNAVRQSDVKRTAPQDGDVRVWLEEASRGEVRIRELERSAPRARATAPSGHKPFTRTRISDRVGTQSRAHAA